MYLRKPLVGTVIAICACFAVPAQAKDGASKIQLSQLHVLGAPVQDIGQVQTAMPGGIILQVGLGIEQSASFSGAYSFAIAGMRFAVQPGDRFRAATMLDNSLGLRAGASLFCSGTIKLPEEVRSKANVNDASARFSKKGHVCLVDDQSDGRFDHAFIDGAKWLEEQRLFAIEPFAYSVRKFEPFNNARLYISFQKGALLQGPILSLSSDIKDGQFMMATAQIGAQPSTAPTIPLEIRVKAGTYPKTLTFGDAQVTILGLDSKSRALIYRVDRGFETRPAIVSVGSITPGPYGTRSAFYTFN